MLALLPELLPDVPPQLLFIAFLVTAFAAAVQGTIGLGFAVLSVPVLSILHPALAPVPQVLVVSILTVSMAYRERQAIRLSGVGWVMLGRLPGLGLGVLLLKIASARTLDMIIGGMVLLAVLILSTRVKVPRTPLTEALAGTVSGVGALVSSIGGPPLALLYRDEEGPAIRANLATIFSLGLVMTISARALASEISRRDLQVSLVLAPAMLIGLLVSRRFMGWVKGPALKAAVLLVSALAAIGLLIRAALTGA